MSLASILTQHLSAEVQFAFNDDGFLLRIQETEEELAIEKFLKIPANEVEQRLVDTLINSPIFAIQFRYNAARALMLSRSQPGRRIPLWLQRLRAADLLQAVKNYPDFPLLLETYRTCLEDYFDLPSLLKVLKQINQGDISLHFINTPHPSPMASGLLFNFLTTQMYDYDRIRNSGEVANVSSVLLAQILSKEKIPAIITQEQVKKKQQRWQHLTTESKAKSQEDLFAIIEKLGPLQDTQIRERSRGNFKSWLSALSKQNRIIKLQESYKGWVVQSHREIYIAPHNAKNAQQILKRYLRVRGPVTQYEIKQRLNIKQPLLHDLLNQLLSDKEIVHGILLKDSPQDYWCDRVTFTELYRAAIAQRRQTKSTVNKSTFITFLLNWQKLANTGQSITDIIERCRGVRFAPYIFEREIIRSRFLQEDASILHHVLNEFYDLIAQGEMMDPDTGMNCYKVYPRMIN
jgi:ATP-dependent Lhr-like helicase